MKKSNFTPPWFLVYILLAQGVAVASIIFDIPFVRQCSVFLFLIFVPGFILLRIFDFRECNLIETILLSIGSSIGFVMLLGVILNGLGLLNLISQPLSTVTITIVFNILIILLGLLSYLTNKDFRIIHLNNLRKIPNLLSYLILPLLALIGVLFVLVLGNNMLLIAVMIAIPIVFISVLLRSNPSYHYPIFIFAVALVLLLSTTLTTKYVYWDDIQVEYRAFMDTKNLLIQDWQWQPGSFVELQSDKSMASVTILPTIYSNLMNIEPNLVFKVIFPIIASLIPLGLYLLYQIHWSKKIAFISAIFFTSNYVYFQTISVHAKPMIAEFFFVLLFFIILKYKNIKKGKWALFMLFVFSLFVSHYSLSYLYIFLILLTFLFGFFFSKGTVKKFSSSVVSFSFILAFFWYLYLSVGPFEEFTRAGRNILRTFIAEFTNLGARENQVQQLIGIAATPSFLHDIARYVQIFVLGLIFIGFIMLIIHLKKDKIGSEYFLFTFLNLGIMFSSILIPSFSSNLGISRLYNFSLIFLSPLFVLGANVFFKKILNVRIRNKPSLKEKKMKFCVILTSIVLITFYVFQTGLLYELSSDPVPTSFALSKYKMENSTVLINENDVFSVKWISVYGSENIWIWTDTWSVGHVWTSYSSIGRDTLLLLSNTTSPQIMFGSYVNEPLPINTNISYIFLSQRSIQDKKIVWDNSNDIYFDKSELPILNDTDAHINKIYTNSGSELYYRVEK